MRNFATGWMRGHAWSSIAAGVILPALALALAACRARPTPTPVPPPVTIAAPSDVGGAGTSAGGAGGATTTALPSPTTLRPIAPTRPSLNVTVAAPAGGAATSVPDAAASATASGGDGTPGAPFPSSADLLGRRLEGGVVGRVYHLDDVRTGEHPGYTRIVWAMTEAAGAPYWTALLRRDAEGTAVIDVTLSDVSAIDRQDEMAAQAVQSPIVDRVQPRRVADDAVLGFAIRLARPAGYTVTLLEGPVRVVVDVAHGP